MKDRVSGTGGYNPNNGAKRYAVYDSASATTPSSYLFLKLDDNPTEVGTALDKDTLLQDSVGAKYSLDESGTPNEVLNRLATITSVAIPTTSWVADGSIFTAQINVSGITANSIPVVDGLIYSGTPTDAVRKAALKAASFIYQMETLSGAVKFYATVKPTVALTIGLRGC